MEYADCIYTLTETGVWQILHLTSAKSLTHKIKHDYWKPAHASTKYFTVCVEVFRPVHLQVSQIAFLGS